MEKKLNWMPERIVARLRRFGANRRGAVAIEFAFAVPMLLLVLCGTIDLGFALHQSSALTNAARTGAQYALRYPTDADGIKDVVQKSLSYDPLTLNVEAKLICECLDKTTIACTDTCSGTPPQAYISVAVSKTYWSPLPTALVLGITTLSGSAVMRTN